MLRHCLWGGQLAAASFVLNLTIRRWTLLFNRTGERRTIPAWEPFAIVDPGSTIVSSRKELLLIDVSLPTDFNTNLLMLFRWFHFIAGITWIGLLYFFNLVNVPFMKELDPATKSKVLPALMTRALWWFRWGSVVTVLMGFAYWGSIVASDARNGGSTPGGPMGRFFWVLAVTWGPVFACGVTRQRLLAKG